MYDLFFMPGETMVPCVIEKWEMSPDGAFWIYNIHKGIKFHNGDTLTAKDVKFSLEHYLAPTAQYSYLRDLIDHVEVTDDYTVKVYTKGPQPGIWSVMTVNVQGWIFPKDYVDKNSWDYFQKTSGRLRPVEVCEPCYCADSVQFEAVEKHGGKRIFQEPNLNLCT